MSDLFFFKDDYLIHKAKQAVWKAPKEPRFQDVFEFTYSDIEFEELTDADLNTLVNSIMFFDVECYSNFFMVAFRSRDNGRVIVFEMMEGGSLDLVKLKWMMERFLIIGYNSIVYDVPILQLALKGATCAELHKASCDIIRYDMRVYAFRKKYKLRDPSYNHIDLIEVAPLQGSLKLYAGRLQTKRMQDLPIDPMKALSIEDALGIKRYCMNDLGNTLLVFDDLEPQLELRDQMSIQYGVDLRSKSDAQIAETVITSELTRQNGYKSKRPDIDSGMSYPYNIPDFVTFRNPALRAMLEAVGKAWFEVDGNGYIIMPPELDGLLLPVGGCVYKMGIGGLHSTESTVSHTADENTLLIDRDVVSYYPSIILNQGLYPQHLGKSFLDVYGNIVRRRIAAKVAGNKVVADSLKITINGSFGKLGSKWSALYAPDLMIQVTITGQLCLLMLIDMIEELGVPVVSANTDGVLIKCPQDRYSDLQARIAWWEQLTGFETEEARYKAVHSRDVNNFLALKDDGTFKVKGTYGEKGSAGNSRLSKNPENLVCNDAVMAIIAKGTPVEETIRGCTDIRRFITIRNVTGGARKSNTYLGKVIRWYYSTEMKGEINRATNGDKIPNTHFARPLMELPEEFPTDIDYERYIEAAREILYNIGYRERPEEMTKVHLGALFS